MTSYACVIGLLRISPGHKAGASICICVTRISFLLREAMSF